MILVLREKGDAVASSSAVPGFQALKISGATDS